VQGESIPDDSLAKMGPLLGNQEPYIGIAVNSLFIPLRLSVTVYRYIP
jgi:hypothetical protein